VGNDPLNATDPTGTMCFPLANGIGRSCAGAGLLNALGGDDDNGGASGSTGGASADAQNSERDAQEFASSSAETQEGQRNPNGLGAAFRGFGGGVVSVFTGTGRSIRFVGRGTGLLGSDEFSDFNRESVIVDEAINVLATNGAVRDEVASQALNAAQNIDLTSHNIGRATGRLVTGILLSPFGLSAVIGDVTSTVETGIEDGSRQLTDRIIESIIFGN